MLYILNEYFELAELEIMLQVIVCYCVITCISKSLGMLGTVYVYDSTVLEIIISLFQGLG